jgi:HEAT repeat protein
MLEDILSILENAKNKKLLDKNLANLNNVDQVVSILETIFDNKQNNLDIRCKALNAIHDLNPDVTKQFFIRNIKDSEPMIRSQICGILSYYSEDEQISNALKEVLLHDEDVDVRLEAVFALEKTGTQDAIPSLREAGSKDHEMNWETRKVSEYTSDAIQEIERRQKQK